MTRLDDSLKGEFVQFKSVGESSQSGHKDADKLKRAAFSNRIRHFVFQLSFWTSVIKFPVKCCYWRASVVFFESIEAW